MKLRMSLATDAALASITQWSSSGYSFTLRFGTHLSSPPRCPDRIAVSFIPQIMQAQAVHLGVAVLKLGARSLRAGRCGNAQHHHAGDRCGRVSHLSEST